MTSKYNMGWVLLSYVKMEISVLCQFHKRNAQATAQLYVLSYRAWGQKRRPSFVLWRNSFFRPFTYEILETPDFHMAICFVPCTLLTQSGVAKYPFLEFFRHGRWNKKLLNFKRDSNFRRCFSMKFPNKLKLCRGRRYAMDYLDNSLKLDPRFIITRHYGLSYLNPHSLAYFRN